MPSNGLFGSNGRVYPLGGISNTKAILNNELGFYPIINTDKYGFHNPKGINSIGKIDIALIGDSFIEGYSVRSENNIAEVMRKSGLNIANLGKGGSGPLSKLAILKEYSEPLVPKIVLWQYHINDFGELHYEMRSSILKSYLEVGGYSQNLISRQNEIDNILKSFVNQEIDKLVPNQGKKLDETSKKRSVNLYKIIKLSRLREMLNLTNQQKDKKKYSMTNPVLFKRIVVKAIDTVSSWEGKFYFVYLPSFDRFRSDGNEFLKEEHDFRQEIINFLKKNSIPTIDLYKEVFTKHPDPKSLWPFKMGGHYNVEGYKLIAETIIKRVMSDGIFQTKSSN